jgi:hypothetical protein
MVKFLPQNISDRNKDGLERPRSQSGLFAEATMNLNDPQQ